MCEFVKWMCTKDCVQIAVLGAQVRKRRMLLPLRAQLLLLSDIADGCSQWMPGLALQRIPFIAFITCLCVEKGAGQLLIVLRGQLLICSFS